MRPARGLHLLQKDLAEQVGWIPEDSEPCDLGNSLF